MCWKSWRHEPARLGRGAARTSRGTQVIAERIPDALPAWRAVLAALGEPAWLVCARRGVVLAINAEALTLLAMTEAAVLDQPADGLIATPEDMAFWDEAAHGSPPPLLSDTVLVDARGSLVPVTRRIRRLAPAAVADASPYLVTLHDRSAQQRETDERELLLSELQATLESTADGILVTDLAGHIRAFNRRFAQIWSLPEALLTDRKSVV